MSSSPVSSKAALRGSSGRRKQRSASALALGLAALPVAALFWSAVTFLSVQHAATPPGGVGAVRFDASLGLKPIVRQAQAERLVAPDKFARLSKPTESEKRQAMLTAEAIKASHKRQTVLAAMTKARVEAEIARAEAKRHKAADDAAVEVAMAAESDASPLVTALVDPAASQVETTRKPFDLVLQEPASDMALALPESVPLPVLRPRTAMLAPEADEDDSEDQKPARGPVKANAKPAVDGDAPEAQSKPRPRNARPEKELAYAKPEKSFFESLFGGGADNGAWPGRGTRIAVYDISGATVYMPDGTRLEAHSGIGEMRDNPKYTHVKMRGPTPPGVFRLSMRESRFHGVEALRMTSVDGTNPRGRDGLLTHSYLLRRSPGDSHGCIAFRNYPAFLNAFKRGHVNMIIVVESMPKSKTQIAQLYRRGV
ncbi:tlde1 domain-containing protein [Rhizobium sp. SG2393]|uniref:tlde1 domain-containing protein n=1 Tax=Rhizobium sp. SG2393 TaxID=3276279 RepID=UPI00366F761A